MITVTRLNGKPIVVNAELIRSVEANPDTTITLVNGDHIIVRESMNEVVAKSIEYGRHLRTLLPRAG
jgi:flagellar protein FlbD